MFHIVKSCPLTKLEWRLISSTLCGRRRYFVADQLWFMTRIREEEEVLSESLPVFLDVCKRSADFSWSCLKSKSEIVHLVASFSVLFGRQESVISGNAIFC